MMRLAAFVVLLVVVGLPLTVLPSPHLGWLAAPAFVAAGAGILVMSTSLTTAGAVVALIEYTVALLLARPAPDLLLPTALGAAVLLLLSLVHLAGRVDGAVVGSAVVRRELGHWLRIVALAVLSVVVLTVTALATRGMLPGSAVPVIIGAALGALLTLAGLAALVLRDTD